MVAHGTFTTSFACIQKAGANVDGTFKGADGETNWTPLIDYAESFINDTARFNFSGAYSSLKPETKFILNDVASSLASIPAITYNMAGYTGRAEAESMININHDTAMRGLRILEDKEKQTFIRTP